jgi:carboxylesterase type B
LVRRSIELNRPVIAVTINYRLNVFGFMSSRELIDEANALGEVPVLNQGVNDQRLALQWIQSSIHHFGGDASKVTTAGESAGAACILYHLKGTQPLFQRAIIESTPALRLRSLDEAQAQFDRLVELTGIPSHASAQEKLAALRCLPADRLVELFDGSLSMPIEDPGWVVPHEHFNSASPTFWGEMPDWCQHVILGHTEDEAALFFTNMRSLSDSQILAFVQSVIPEVPIEKFSHKGESILQQLIAWVTEDTFVRPAIEMALTACSTGHKVYFYSIATKDPFPGPLQGFSWHSVGVPMTFYQPPGRVYASIAATQERMSSAHLDFVHGLEPWEAFGKARRHMCWDGEGSRMVMSGLAVEGEVNSDRGQAMNGLEPNRGLAIIGQALALQTK